MTRDNGESWSHGRSDDLDRKHLKHAMEPRLANVAQLADILESIRPEFRRPTSADGETGAEAISERVVLGVYVRAVREVRAVALEARARIERTAAVLTEAREFARRQRRRADKIAAARKSGS